MVGEIAKSLKLRSVRSKLATLYYSTLHTGDAKGSVSHFAEFFSQSAQNEIRSPLATILPAVINQHLIPSVYKSVKRELTLEIMFNTLPVANTIWLAKTEMMDNCLLTGRTDGMITLNKCENFFFRPARSIGQPQNISSRTSLILSDQILPHVAQKGHLLDETRTTTSMSTTRSQ